MKLTKKQREAVVQTGVAVFSLTAMATSYATDPAVRYWSPILGLIGEPFWLWIAYQNRMWGVGVISICYGCVFSWGLLKITLGL